MDKRWMTALAGLLLAGAVRAGPPEPVPATLPATPAPAATPAPVSSSAIAGACCDDCPVSCCDFCCPACGPAGRFWASGELLYWAAQGDRLPPLVTASPAGTPRAAAGVLGAPGTRVLFGGNVNNDLEPGFRVNAGAWLNDSRTIGVEGSWFFIGEHGTNFVAGSADGSSIVSRPFFDAARGVPSAELVSFPGVVGGTVSANSNTYVNGADANLRFNLCCGCTGRLDALVGYRYLGLRDNLDITENLTALGAGGLVTPGTSILVRDRFRTETDFHGGQVGLAGEVWYGRVFAGGSAKVALGNSRVQTSINGATTTTAPGGLPVTRTGGLLAQGTNIGTYARNEFAVLPEASLRLGVLVTDNLRAFAGYNFLYVSRVGRAGDQIDTRVNPTQLPPGVLAGAPQPAFPDRETDFWLQGISAGLELRY